MFKGFYNLTSAMLSQGRRLDVVAHNMTNISTVGFRGDRYTDSTFQDVLISRVGNKNKAVSTEMGNETYILAPSQLYTDYTQGSLEETGLPLDFAIWGDGFFAVLRDGEVGYTRSGSFVLDDNGMLCLAGQGQVLDREGGPAHPADHGPRLCGQDRRDLHGGGPQLSGLPGRVFLPGYRGAGAQ